MKKSAFYAIIFLMLKVGCCGFYVSQKRYFESFEVIEIQQSFYRSLGDKQVTNWKQRAPSNFEFILKAPQCITHPPQSPTYRRSDLPLDKRRFCGAFKLNEVTEAVMEDFLQKARRLQANKFVFQTPASLKPTPDIIANFKAFFKFYQGQGIFIWEPRGPDWSPDLIKALCQELNLIHATDPLLELPPQWGDFCYFRLHGNLKNYHYDYSDAELNTIARLASPQGYVMFNNSQAYDNALRFKEIISQSKS